MKDQATAWRVERRRLKRSWDAARSADPKDALEEKKGRGSAPWERRERRKERGRATNLSSSLKTPSVTVPSQRCIDHPSRTIEPNVSPRPPSSPALIDGRFRERTNLDDFVLFDSVSSSMIIPPDRFGIVLHGSETFFSSGIESGFRG